MKRRSKSPRKKLVRKLDSVHSLYIRARDKRCVTCGTTENLTCGHLFSRTNYATRWHERNCHGQCKGCNMRHEFDPVPFTQFFIRRFGLDAYDELYREHRTVTHFKDAELAELITKYEELTK